MRDVRQIEHDLLWIVILLVIAALLMGCAVSKNSKPFHKTELRAPAKVRYWHLQWRAKPPLNQTGLEMAPTVLGPWSEAIALPKGESEIYEATVPSSLDESYFRAFSR